MIPSADRPNPRRDRSRLGRIVRFATKAGAAIEACGLTRAHLDSAHMARPRPPAPAAPGIMRPAMRDRRAAVPGSFVGTLLVLVLAALYLLRLVPQAAHARLYMDEPFHAYVAEWIAHHGALPRELPEFYSGLPYFYPPLLHLIAAVWVALLGATLCGDSGHRAAGVPRRPRGMPPSPAWSSASHSRRSRPPPCSRRSWARSPRSTSCGGNAGVRSGCCSPSGSPSCSGCPC